MFLTVHAATGVIIGQTINSAPLAFLFGLIFHFLMDMIPHGDQHLIRMERKERIKLMASIASIDAVIMGSFLVFIFNKNLNLNYMPVAFGIIGSILPDFFMGLVQLFYNKMKFLHKFSHLHHALHFFNIFEKFKPNFKTGIVMQLIILLLLASIIL